MSKPDLPSFRGVPAGHYGESKTVVDTESVRTLLQRYGDACYEAGKARNGPPHQYYRTGDKDAPSQICDRNGEVVLSLCKHCGLAEVELEGSPVCLAGLHPVALSEFAEDQWWVQELAGAAKTSDQMRAVAVVRHMLQAIKADLSRRVALGLPPVEFHKKTSFNPCEGSPETQLQMAAVIAHRDGKL